MNVEGYAGICCQCFCPIENQDLFRVCEGGRKFHRKCVEEHPNGYYVRIEKRRAVKASKEVSQ
jgi:hypothetical protein